MRVLWKECRISVTSPGPEQVVIVIAQGLRLIVQMLPEVHEWFENWHEHLKNLQIK
jgi:hypothetical protein